jgi:prepilin peptidase CpaA
MFDLTSRWSVVCVLLLTALAGLSDARSGMIPNHLTLPVLVLGPLVHAVLGGADAIMAAVGSALLCGAAPLVLFARGAIGGGDVKLFAAVGAIGGAHVGLELQFGSYVIGLMYALLLLARRGELQATCVRAGALLVAPLSRGRVHAPQLGAMTCVRLGVPAFLAGVLLLLPRVLGVGP